MSRKRNLKVRALRQSGVATREDAQQQVGRLFPTAGTRRVPTSDGQSTRLRQDRKIAAIVRVFPER